MLKGQRHHSPYHKILSLQNDSAAVILSKKKVKECGFKFPTNSRTKYICLISTQNHLITLNVRLSHLERSIAVTFIGHVVCGQSSRVPLADSFLIAKNKCLVFICILVAFLPA